MSEYKDGNNDYYRITYYLTHDKIFKIYCEYNLYEKIDKFNFSAPEEKKECEFTYRSDSNVIDINRECFREYLERCDTLQFDDIIVNLSDLDNKYDNIKALNIGSYELEMKISFLKIPKSIEFIKMFDSIIDNINYLPNKLKTLILYDQLKQNLKYLPVGMEKLDISIQDWHIKNEFDYLPSNIIYLHLFMQGINQCKIWNLSPLIIDLNIYNKKIDLYLPINILNLQCIVNNKCIENILYCKKLEKINIYKINSNLDIDANNSLDLLLNRIKSKFENIKIFKMFI